MHWLAAENFAWRFLFPSRAYKHADGCPNRLSFSFFALLDAKFDCLMVF